MLNWLMQKFRLYGAKVRPRAFNQVMGTTRLLAIDLELTSLVPSGAEVTSIGWVQGINNQVALNSCEYSVVKTATSLGQSPVIHGLIHDDIQQGRSLNDIMSLLHSRLASCVLVFHNANLDLAVLDRMFLRLGLPSIDIVYIDTLKLAVYQLQKQHAILPNNSATLTACRQRLGLPKVPEHNALDDALATLQLCFAQCAELGVTEQSPLSDLYHTHSVGVKRLSIPKRS